MAVVFRALAEGPYGFLRPLALKRIRPSLSKDPRFVSLLAREARVAALLSHPSVIQVYELGEAEGEPYLTMELVEGRTLQSVLRQLAHQDRQMPLSVACHVVASLAGALAHLHNLSDAGGRPRLLHRDLSPSNVMLTPHGEVKLIDFGIAVPAAELAAEDGGDRPLCGKVGYLSPEVAGGGKHVPESDLFALGVIFHEMLSMRRLFYGSNDFEILKMISRCQLEPPSAQGALVPRDVEAVVMRLLQRWPAARFNDGSEVAGALTAICRRLNGDGASVRELFRGLGPEPPDWRLVLFTPSTAICTSVEERSPLLKNCPPVRPVTQKRWWPWKMRRRA
jgi:serine/threonine-protein kinase